VEVVIAGALFQHLACPCVHGCSQGGTKWEFATTWKLGLRNKKF